MDGLCLSGAVKEGGREGGREGEGERESVWTERLEIACASVHERARPVEDIRAVSHNEKIRPSYGPNFVDVKKRRVLHPSHL